MTNTITTPTTSKVHYHVKLTSMQDITVSDFPRPYYRPAMTLARNICRSLKSGPAVRGRFAFRIKVITPRKTWCMGNEYYHTTISVIKCDKAECTPDESEYRFWKGAK